jgi:hypothetical protein
MHEIFGVGDLLVFTLTKPTIQYLGRRVRGLDKHFLFSSYGLSNLPR